MNLTALRRQLANAAIRDGQSAPESLDYNRRASLRHAPLKPPLRRAGDRL